MQIGHLKRREFITLLGSLAAWPLAARAQQPDRMRRIGVLSGLAQSNPSSQAMVAAFDGALAKLGWTRASSVAIEYRWGGGGADEMRRQAAELAAHAPDVIFVAGGLGLERLLQATRSVPIVFAVVPDPLGSGFIESLSRPGGNATGFLMFEYSLSGKWVELLKEIAPNLTRAAVLRDPAIAAGTGQFAVIQSVAPSRGVEVIPINMRDAAEIERAVAAFARSSNGGLIVTAGAATIVDRELIPALAAKYKLPAVYPARDFVTSGGLISYGADFIDQYRRSASYVDRILKGEKPADLPVQAPTRYELIINLKTAKALGIEIPPTLLARADEVIE
jgi:putative tryptophan/tyrosine transport system substrate-binding protein